ncbi:uncharacterized protein LOC121405715 isoform X3 [Lytechinus variegatus]|uniref:uncharacterized protein LOC121405715 isoform X3 n=1 Tax=Lytechinus variegatus TaxID=7654 RepID=UPI001BB2016B|nr:uncharacterized protein LOC121405715 isoform X3 [Lytechinus variegatus]
MQSSPSHLAGCQVLLIGDSIVRHATFNGPFSSETLCFPGANVTSLRSSFVKSFPNYFDFSTKAVFIHVGTNNLELSVWEKDSKAFRNLYISVRERFRCAKIIFSAILPRWDCEQLYQKSLYNNSQLKVLCDKLSCYYFDGSEPFELDDSYFSFDGLHLSVAGAQHLSTQIEDYIISKLQYTQPSYSPTCTRIPSELKKLYTPLKKKKNVNVSSARSSKQWGYFNPDVEIERRRKRSVTKRERWKCGTIRTPDGFQTVKKSFKPSPTPPLPPNRHIPEFRCTVLIPYKRLHQSHHPLPSCIPLPGVKSQYILHKKRKKPKRKRKRKVHPAVYSVYTQSQLSLPPYNHVTNPSPPNQQDAPNPPSSDCDQNPSSVQHPHPSSPLVEVPVHQSQPSVQASQPPKAPIPSSPSSTGRVASESSFPLIDFDVHIHVGPNSIQSHTPPIVYSNNPLDDPIPSSQSSIACLLPSSSHWDGMHPPIRPPDELFQTFAYTCSLTGSPIIVPDLSSFTNFNVHLTSSSLG